jgi:hypothetical protein
MSRSRGRFIEVASFFKVDSKPSTVNSAFLDWLKMVFTVDRSSGGEDEYPVRCQDFGLPQPVLLRNPSVCCRAKNQHVLYFDDTRFFLGDLGSEGRAAF